jgi:hypothetical protein
VTGHVVATERLGWPRRRRWSLFNLVEVQRKLVYDDEPDRPTATCHLQTADDSAALCGFPWEMLVEIPGAPHGMLWTHGAEVNEVLLRFIGGDGVALATAQAAAANGR